MSADTTVVIAAHRFDGDGELSYTAAVIQAVENLTDHDSATCLKYARAHFIDGQYPWFKGSGGLRRVKQFAALLAEEQRENGILEYENRPIIEIGKDRVYVLTRRGQRRDDVCSTDKPSHSPWQTTNGHRDYGIPNSSRYASR